MKTLHLTKPILYKDRTDLHPREIVIGNQSLTIFSTSLRRLAIWEQSICEFYREHARLPESHEAIGLKKV